MAGYSLSILTTALLICCSLEYCTAASINTSLALLEATEHYGFFWAKERTLQCAGVLLSNNWVLSAAHCFTGDSLAENVSKWKVRVGNLAGCSGTGAARNLFGQVFNKTSWQSCWDSHISKIVKHPDFDPQPLWSNDLALLKLTDAVPIGSTAILGVATLPNSITQLPSMSSTCNVTSWTCSGSKANDDAASVSDPVNLLAYSDCSNIFPAISASNQFCVSQTAQMPQALCPIAGAPITCGGVMMGMASFPDPKESNLQPTGVTSIAPYINWISNVIEFE